MDFRERMTALDDCIGRLPPMYAHAIQSTYRDSHTLAQLATAAGDNEEAIKKRLQRARASAGAHRHQHGQHHHRPDPVERRGIGEREVGGVHGSVLHRVWERRSSAHTRRNATSSSAGTRKPATTKPSTERSPNCR